MDGFACSCGWMGEEPEFHRTTERDEFQGSPVFNTLVIKTCPDCDNDDLIEIALCEGCEMQEAEPGYDDCRTCLTEKGEIEAEFRRDQIAETQLLLKGAA